MKIGFDAKRAFCNHRGLGAYSRSLIKSILDYQQNHKLSLFTPKAHHLFQGFFTKFENAEVILPQDVFSRTLHPLWRSYLLSGLIENKKLDLYHGLSHELPAFMQNKKFKKVVTIHDLMYLLYPKFFSAIDRRIFHHKVKYACEKSDGIIAICNETKNDLIQHLGVEASKIVVLYQSINESYFEPFSNSVETLPTEIQDKDYILSVGAFVENKNFHGLMDAFVLIKDKLIHDLVIVGLGSLEQVNNLKNYASKLEIESRVHIFNNVSSLSLMQFYKGCSLFTLVSFHEGFGRPIIEAMALGRAVVTSRGSAHEEAAGGQAELVDPKSSSEISAKILQIIENRELKVQLEANGPKHAMKFHPQNTSQEIIQYYEQIIGR